MYPDQNQRCTHYHMGPTRAWIARLLEQVTRTLVGGGNEGSVTLVGAQVMGG